MEEHMHVFIFHFIYIIYRLSFIQNYQQQQQHLRAAYLKISIKIQNAIHMKANKLKHSIVIFMLTVFFLKSHLEKYLRNI